MSEIKIIDRRLEPELEETPAETIEQALQQACKNVGGGQPPVQTEQPAPGVDYDCIPEIVLRAQCAHCGSVAHISHPVFVQRFLVSGVTNLQLPPCSCGRVTRLVHQRRPARKIVEAPPQMATNRAARRLQQALTRRASSRGGV